MYVICFFKKWERIFLEEGVEGFIGKLEKYIHYYNNERISLKLKGMSPVYYRAHSQETKYLIFV